MAGGISQKPVARAIFSIKNQILFQGVVNFNNSMPNSNNARQKQNQIIITATI